MTAVAYNLLFPATWQGFWPFCLKARAKVTRYVANNILQSIIFAFKLVLEIYLSFLLHKFSNTIWGTVRLSLSSFQCYPCQQKVEELPSKSHEICTECFVQKRDSSSNSRMKRKERTLLQNYQQLLEIWMFIFCKLQ